MAGMTKFTLSHAGPYTLARPRHGTFVTVEWKSSLNAIGTKRLRVTVSPHGDRAFYLSFVRRRPHLSTKIEGESPTKTFDMNGRVCFENRDRYRVR